MKNKMKHLFALGICFSVLISSSAYAFAEGPSQKKTGFLVVAPDRGFLGNREIRAAFEEFKQAYPAALSLVGRNYNGVGTEYSSYLSSAIEELKQAGANEIVAIPFFLSAANPVLKKVTPHLPAYAAGGTIQWASPMAESYLTAQILLDRVDALTQNPEQERLVVIGIGVMDEEAEKQMTAELKRLADYVARYRKFKEVKIGVYYHRDVEKELKERKNNAVNDLIALTAGQKGRTLVVPFFIGPKFSHMMSVTHWLGESYKKLNVVYGGKELLPHPNVLIWLKKTANRYVAVREEEIGVVVMPHGATQPWNDAVEKVIAPLQKRYRIEMAYGMGDPWIIEEAVLKLEQQGIKRVVFVRMYALSSHFKEKTDYILGLTQDPPRHGHGGAPPQVRSSVLFETFGGYEEDPLIAKILLERILEVSREPEKETVILLAHGARTDEDDATWRRVMSNNADRIKKMAKSPFRDIQVATVREDWPEKREIAVAQLKEMIKQGNQGGRALLISNRLYGSGPYKKFLEGEEYVMNEKGFAPHPVLTRWLESGIQRAIREMNNTPVRQASRLEKAPATR